MQAPTVDRLPPPPPGQHGWPWTTGSPLLPACRPDGSPWPRLSVVTPNYNYGRFLEETIRSVLLQGYPNLDYSVVDGASSDESVDIIRKYSRWFSYWVSEPDRGQAQAINKGFAHATGDLLAWLNSDDLYLPSALQLLAEAHARSPMALLLGDVENFAHGEERARVIHQANVTFRNVADPWHAPWSFHQPGLAVPRALYLAVGPLDESLRYTFDHDWLCRLTQRATVSYIAAPVARFRMHADTKTIAERPAQFREGVEVIQRYWDMLPDLDKRYARAICRVHEAEIYLGQHASYAPFWDRRSGLRCLFSACCEYHRIVFRPDFRKLCLRALLPQCLLRSNPWRASSPQEVLSPR